MESSLIAYALIKSINHEGRSALPHAPVIAERRIGRARMRLNYLRGRLASLLHEAAWAIEPAPSGCDVIRGVTPKVPGREMSSLLEKAEERA